MDEAQERNMRMLAERTTSDLFQNGMNLLVSVMWCDYLNRNTGDTRKAAFDLVKEIWEEKINSRRAAEHAVINNAASIPADEKPVVLKIIDDAFAKANELFGDIVSPSEPKVDEK